MAIKGKRRRGKTALDEALFPSPLVDFYDVDMLTGEARPLVVWERGA